MRKRLSKAIRNGYGVGPPSAAEINHLEQGATHPVPLRQLIAESIQSGGSPTTRRTTRPRPSVLDKP